MKRTDSNIVERLSTAQQKPTSEPHRFAVLVIGAFCSMCTSFLYAFNLVSGAMQSRYDLTQRDLSTISTVGIAVGYFLLPYSFIYDHFGPRPIFLLALTLFPLGTLLFALTFQDIIEGSVVRLSVYNAFMTLGCMLFDLGGVVTVLSLFPSNRGAVVAIMKTFAGLGSAIVGSIQLAFFSDRPDIYYFFLMGFAVAVGSLAIVFVRLPPFHLTGYEENHLSDEEKEQRRSRKAVYLKQKAPLWRFIYGFVLLITLIVFLPLQGALLAYLQLGDSFKVGFAATVIALTVVFPFMAVPIKIFDHAAAEEDKTPTENARSEELPSVEDAVETDVDYIAPQFQETFIESLRTVRLWCLLWSIFCCVGAEFVIIFNARFIYTALAGEVPDDALNTLLTVLNGVGSAVGRLLMSGLEIWTQKRKAEDRIPITVALFVPSCCIITMLTLFLVLPNAALPLPYFIAAVANGFMATTIALVARTIFAKDPAKHYDFCFLGSMLSAIFLNRLLYGEWYTRQAEKREEDVCLDRVCVVMPLAFLLGLSFLAFITSTYIHLEYRALCNRALEERRRIKEGEELQDASAAEVVGGNNVTEPVN